MIAPTASGGTAAPILRFGDPVLRCVCAPVGAADADVARLAETLLATIHAHRARHGWGRAIAAPQVGIRRRLVAMSIAGRETVLVDPEIAWTSDAVRETWDDCMSLPEIAVRVVRRESVTVRYRDLDGAEHAFERAPFELSELLQHELDHLDGVLMVDRAVPLGNRPSIVARENRELALPATTEGNRP